MRLGCHHQKAYAAGAVWRLVGAWLLLAAALHAERLPIKAYTTADGLAHDYITRIVRDARGFLWIGTVEGLSRFDGYQFTTYTKADGLPHRSVRDVLETRGGEYWVATADGLARLNPMAAGASPKFKVYRPDPAFKNAYSVRRLLEDRGGAIWCGTDGGLFRLRAGPGGGTFEPVPLVAPAEGPSAVRALLEDRRGDLWIGTQKDLFRRRSDGRLERYTTDQHGLPSLFEMTDLAEDRRGRIWLATRWAGLHRLVPDPSPDRPVVADRFFDTRQYSDNLLSLFRSSDGRLWAGRYHELAEVIVPEHAGPVTFRRYTAAHGLEGIDIWAMNEDRDGNLWVGSETRGVLKIARHGFTIYDETDGLSLGYIHIIPNPEGTLHAFGNNVHARAFVRWDGQRFVPFQPRLAAWDSWWGFTAALQDRTGDWWFPTGGGLAYFPKSRAGLPAGAPSVVYTMPGGPSANFIFGLYEDTHGDLWIAQNGSPPGGLTRWARATGTFHHYARAQDTPFLNDNFISAIGEDAAGQMWFGLWYGGLVRHRDGRFTRFTAEEGIPAGLISQIYQDAAGRLWVASTSGGVARVEEPTAERPRFVRYDRAHGLASDQVHSITEDRGGRLYFGTGRGINRLDPATGRLQHYTTADGLPENTIGEAYRDRDGRLWFATRKGLVRLDPAPDRPTEPPVTLISGLRVGGAPWPVSALGQAEVKGVEVPPGQSPIQVDFFGLYFAAGERLRYQYRLEGDRLGWREPTEARTLDLTLPPGTHRLEVRTVSSDGQSSPSPAVVTLTVRRPVWQRWWFLTLAGLLAAALMYAAYRYRLARLIELERVRTRIATDLHDDIGSSLSHMAILSEVARRSVGRDDGRARDLLAEIAESSRALVDSMSDIVWAMNPSKDRLGDLAQRMRRFAAEFLPGHGIECDWRPADLPEGLPLDADRRRQVFLIFKETLHNLARHAGATTAAIAFGVEGPWLMLRVEDDGRGFDPEAGGDGHGLPSMRQRAGRVGGRLDIRSHPGQGTTVLLQVPLSGR